MATVNPVLRQNRSNFVSYSKKRRNKRKNVHAQSEVLQINGKREAFYQHSDDRSVRTIYDRM